MTSTLKTYYIFKMNTKGNMEYLYHRNCYSRKDKYLIEMFNKAKELFPKHFILLLEEKECYYSDSIQEVKPIVK